MRCEILRLCNFNKTSSSWTNEICAHQTTPPSNHMYNTRPCEIDYWKVRFIFIKRTCPTFSTPNPMHNSWVNKRGDDYRVYKVGFKLHPLGNRTGHNSTG